MKLIEEKYYTLVQDEIELHSNSVEYIKILDSYKEVKEAPEYFKSPIVHLYAKKDTYDSAGSLEGYTDALFFECKVYDTVDKIVYTSECLHDSLEFFEVVPTQVKIFKDGSTLVKFSCDVKLKFLQGINTYKVELKDEQDSEYQMSQAILGAYQ